MFEELLRLTNQTISTLAASLRKWMADPLLRSTEITVTVPVGQSVAGAEHGLGRAMNGAIVIGADGNYGVTPVLGRSAKYVYVQTTTAVSGVPLTVRLRVF